MADVQHFKFPNGKHPDGEFSFGVDYSNDLESGETVSSVETTAIDLSDGSDAKPAILSGSPQIQDGTDINGETVTNAKVSQKVVGGEVGKSYKITMNSTTSKPDVFPAEIQMDVKHGIPEP